MAEDRVKEKQIRVSDRATAMWSLTNVNIALAAETANEANLSQLKLTLKEKLSTI